MARDTTSLHLAVALDGAGWHPAAWRAPDARPDALLTAGYWTELVQEAERGELDLVTIEDSLAMQSSVRGAPDDRTDQVRGRLDAVLVAARVAPVTRHIGLVPTIVVPHTEPFHISKAIATLDYVSGGRAGLRVLAAAHQHEARLVGRREFAQPADPARWQEAADYVEVVRRLWDSWEDDAVIRDVATGRFVDIGKLHYIDFEGESFRVKGPSITPRPPQGQPLVTALAHTTEPYRLAARSADIAFVTPKDAEDARRIVGEVRAAETGVGRSGDPLRVLADIVVFFDGADRLARLDELAGTEYTSDALVFTGSAAELADLVVAWSEQGLAGVRLRPGELPHDLLSITQRLVPELRRRGVFRDGYDDGTLRDRFGLPRPANRYVSS